MVKILTIRGVFLIIVRGRFGFLRVSVTEWSSKKLKREGSVLFMKNNMKKSVAHKRSQGSSSSSFDTKRFVSADAEARFHHSIKRRARLKERI